MNSFLAVKPSAAPLPTPPILCLRPWGTGVASREAGPHGGTTLLHPLAHNKRRAHGMENVQWLATLN
jgi:hypothetical protein